MVAEIGPDPRSEEIPEQPKSGIGLQDDQIALVFSQVGLGNSLHVIRGHPLDSSEVILGHLPLAGQQPLAYEFSQGRVALVPDEGPAPDIALQFGQLPRGEGLLLNSGDLPGERRPGL